MKRGLLFFIVMALSLASLAQDWTKIIVGPDKPNKTELQSLKGVTGNLQTQLNGKLDVGSGIVADDVFAKIDNTGIIQFQDNIIKTVQGTTSETLVGTYTIKGGSIGANGSLDIFWNPHINATGNACTFRLYANGLLIATATLNTNNYAPLYTWIINTGATNSQKLGSSTTISGSQWSANTVGLTQLTIDTMQNITITATIQPSATTPNIGYIDRIRAITYYSK